MRVRKDWSATLQDVAESYPMLLPDRVVAYLDPPYLAKSPRLYALSFDPAELTANCLLYKGDRMTPSPEGRRLLGIRRLSEELLLTTLPSRRVPADDVLRPLVSRKVAKGLGSV